MISVLILDADGVLVNGEKFINVLPRDFDIDKVKEREYFTTTFQECLIGKRDLKESITPYLPLFKFPGTVDEFLEYWFKAEHSIDERLMEYIQKIRQSGIKVVLASNQEIYRTKYMLEHMRFKGKFDEIYFSAHMGVKKPDQDFFDIIIKDLKVKKDKALLIDDEQKNIDGALQYGIKAELYSDFDKFLELMHEKYGVTV